MGFSHSWIAVKGLAPDAALEAMGMEIRAVPKGTDFLEGVALIEWQDDWLLIVSDDSEDAFDGRLSRLSALGKAVSCSINEHVMYSEARGYEAGKQIWRVVHDPEEHESLYALDVEGSAPEQLDRLSRDARAEQDAEGGDEANVDIFFDVPPKLAQSICGFMLGEGDPDLIDHAELKIIGVEEKSAAKPGFFARLFGRG